MFQVCCQYSVPNCQFRDGKALLSLPLPEDSKEFALGKSLSDTVMKVFSYSDGTAHLEFFITQAGEVVFLEVAARTPGAIIVPMYKEAFGVNLLNLELLTNFTDMDYAQEVKHYCFSGILPYQKGRVTKLNVPSHVAEHKIDHLVKVGDLLPTSRNLRDIAAKVIVKSDTFTSLKHKFDNMCEFLAVETEEVTEI